MNELKEILEKRDGRMHGYWKSVFKDGYEGGYPIAWDNEFEQELKTYISNLNYEAIKKGALRTLLNDFLCDIDNKAEIDTDLANAIVDVHLKKMEAYISNLLDSTALEYDPTIYGGIINRGGNTALLVNEQKGYNQAVAEQHKRIKLVKENI